MPMAGRAKNAGSRVLTDPKTLFRHGILSTGSFRGCSRKHAATVHPIHPDSVSGHDSSLIIMKLATSAVKYSAVDGPWELLLLYSCNPRPRRLLRRSWSSPFPTPWTLRGPIRSMEGYASTPLFFLFHNLSWNSKASTFFVLPLSSATTQLFISHPFTQDCYLLRVPDFSPTSALHFQ